MAKEVSGNNTQICPGCGAEIGDAVTLCANCGTYIDMLMPNNAEAIDKMFEVQRDGGDPNAILAEMNLTDEQMDDLTAGGVIDLPRVVDRTINDVDFEDDPSVLEEETPTEETTPIVIHSNTEKTNFKKFFKVMLLIVLYLIGIVGGASTVFFYTQNLYVQENYKVSYEILSVVIKDVEKQYPKDTEFIPYEMYIQKGDNLESVIFGVLKRNEGDYQTVSYRVSIENNNIPDKRKAVLFRPFDQQLYDQLKSGNDMDKLTAATLKTYDETYRSLLAEIQQKRANWIELDVNFLYYQVKMERAGKMVLY